MGSQVYQVKLQGRYPVQTVSSLTKVDFTKQENLVVFRQIVWYNNNKLTIYNFPTSEPPQIGPFSFPADVVDEGSFAQVTCSVTKGDEPLTITWSLQGAVISSEPSLTTTMIGTRTSILIISSVGYRHSGIYTCRAMNPAGSVTHSAELKVNGQRSITLKRDRKERFVCLTGKALDFGSANFNLV